MRVHLDEIDRVINSPLSKRNSQYHSIISDLSGLVDTTASEIMTAIVSLEYWNDVLNGTTRRPVLRINPESMNHTQLTRVFGYRSAPYTQRLQVILAELPRLAELHRLTKSNIDTSFFRRL